MQKLPSADHPFGIYVRADRVLVVTGIGKTNMAGAMGYTYALFNSPQSPVLINLGIAGQCDESLGTLCLGHKILDTENGRCFYPQLPFSVPCQTYTVVTASQANTEYSANEMYDMEAAGFYEMAIKFSFSELIHVLKIISDNAQCSISDINELQVDAWMVKQISVIERLIIHLNELRQLSVVTTGREYREIVDAFHFTLSRSLKLKALLQRWHVLKANETIGWRKANLRSAKELLFWLEEKLDSIDFCL